MKRWTLLTIMILLFLVASCVTLTDMRVVHRTWGVKDSKAYAKDKLYAWEKKQFKCLDELWTLESNWRPNAYNKVKVMGKNAGGIPQLLGMSPKTPATIQIDRGLNYIIERYSTPCKALAFHKKHWYY